MSIVLSLSHKVALITGGSRGIGAATVRLFAAAGAKVVFSYEKSHSQAEALRRQCGETDCQAVVSNLNGPAAGRALVAEVVSRFGRLDILIANHGVWPAQDKAIDEMPDEQWRSTLAINLDGVFGLVKHAVGQMKTQPRIGAAAGHIVLISSTSGQRGEAFHCDYSASKGALISMYDSPGTGRYPGGDRRASSVLMHRTRRVHHRGNLQRKRWRGALRVKSGKNFCPRPRDRRLLHPNQV